MRHVCSSGSEFCFRNFTSSSGVIESPGFPDKYPHNLECSYIIMAPPHMDITLTFLTFDLENDPLLVGVGEGDCKYDWLDVWDGLPQGEDSHAHTCSHTPAHTNAHVQRKCFSGERGHLNVQIGQATQPGL